MGFLPERLSTRDKALLGVVAVALVGGAAGYFFLSGSPTADDDKPAAAAGGQAAAPGAKPAEKKELEVQDTTPTPATGGPRVNPDYKGGG